MKLNIATLMLAVVTVSLYAVSAFGATAGGFVGAGIGMAPDYEGSDDHEASAAFFGRYTWESGRYVALAGTTGAGQAGRIKANLVPESMSDMWQAGPVLQFRNERDDVDNDKVDSMRKVDSAVEAGAFLGLQSGPWGGSLTYATDVSDEHDGSLIELEGSYTVAMNERLHLTFGANLTYADDDYMDTYFGVNAADAAASGLSTYSADSGIKDVGLSLTARYRLDKSWGLLGSLAYDRLLNDAEDSPLVDDEGDKNQFGATLAVTYSF